MKERGILFSAPMVMAILEGRKSMTRRIINPQPMTTPPGGYRMGDALMNPHNNKPMYCPYGHAGDQLWVKETWAKTHVAQAGVEEWFVYRECDNRTDYGGPWKSSRFMPRIASRILLEITDVRVERLREITGKDVLAEGAVLRPHIDSFGRNPVSAFDEKVYTDLLSLFASGWNKINGPGSWEANPWVWVVSFKRVK